MVDNVRFVSVKLLARKFGGIAINIALNTFVRFVSQKYGPKAHVCMCENRVFPRYEKVETAVEEKIIS